LCGRRLTGCGLLAAPGLAAPHLVTDRHALRGRRLSRNARAHLSERVPSRGGGRPVLAGQVGRAAGEGQVLVTREGQIHGVVVVQQRRESLCLPGIHPEDNPWPAPGLLD
jgi:hypothetical protein